MANFKNLNSGSVVDLKNLLKTAAKSEHPPVFLSGRPGIGKSDIIKQYADSIGRKLYTFYPAYMSADEVIGLPTVDKATNSAAYTKSQLVNVEPNSVVFLDEITNTMPHVMAVLQQYILQRRIGDYSLPEDTIMILAGNRLEDGCNTNELSNAIINRINWFNYEGANIQEFTEYMEAANFHPAVRVCIKESPDFLSSKELDGNPFCTPRSLEAFSRLLNKNPEMPLKQQLSNASGLCGESFAKVFALYADIYTHIPSVDDILAYPKNTAKAFKEFNLKIAYTVAYKVDFILKNFKTYQHMVSAKYAKLPAEAAVYACCMEFLNNLPSKEPINYFVVQSVNKVSSSNIDTFLKNAEANVGKSGGEVSADNIYTPVNNILIQAGFNDPECLLPSKTM
jgi:hypothetical protein